MPRTKKDTTEIFLYLDVPKIKRFAILQNVTIKLTTSGLKSSSSYASSKGYPPVLEQHLFSFI
jgi:hypothetical protein